MNGDLVRVDADSLISQATLTNQLLTMAIEPVLEKLGITVSTFEILSAVAAAGKRSTQASIAERLGIRPPSLTEGLKIAVAKGLVVQAPSETDSRSKTVTLTRDGQKALKAALQSMNSLTKTVVEEISADELAVAVRVLKRTNVRLARLLESQ